MNSTTSSIKFEEPEFKLGMKWSLIGHGGFFVLLLLKFLVFQGHPKTYTPTLRVDLVALPDVLKKDLQLPQIGQKTRLNQEITEALKKAENDAKRIQTEKNTLETAKPNEMALHSQSNLSKTEIRNKQALLRLKALAKIQNLNEDTHAEHNSPSQIKGNQISSGSSLSGEAKESLKTNYNDILLDRLTQNWKLPIWLDRLKLSAQVTIFIDSQGKVSKLLFETNSGNSQFDEEIKKAIAMSQPFPPPPSEITGTLLDDGISFGFPL